jgi:hypothetical protein
MSTKLFLHKCDTTGRLQMARKILPIKLRCFSGYVTVAILLDSCDVQKNCTSPIRWCTNHRAQPTHTGVKTSCSTQKLYETKKSRTLAVIAEK